MLLCLTLEVTTDAFSSESIKFKNISLEEGEICNMLVVEAVDPDNIICQSTDSSSELTELMRYLEESYKGKNLPIKKNIFSTIHEYWTEAVAILSTYCPFALLYCGIP